MVRSYDKVLEDHIHHSLEGGLKDASVHAECCLLLVVLSDIDIIVSLVHIELGEIVYTLEAMD
jgi:hypothetical protein